MIKRRTVGFIYAITNLGGLLMLFSGISIISMIQLLVNVLHFLISWKKKGIRNSVETRSHNIPRIFTKFSTRFHHLKRDVKDFIRMSSIHGVNNLSKGFGSKVFWSAVIVLAASTFVTFVRDLSKGFDQNRIFIRTDDEMWTDKEVFV